MPKPDLFATLNAALDHLSIAAITRRSTAAQRDEWAAFVQQTRATLIQTASNDGEPARPVWRIAEVVNPRSGRVVVLEVRRDGKLSPSDATRLGFDLVSAWTEVRAVSRVEARQLIAQGQGVRLELHEARGRIGIAASVDRQVQG